jgi:hypothetical protein
MTKADIIFLSHRFETFVDLVQDPQSYFRRHPDSILPESNDLKISAAALYLLVDCYLRGKGIIYHPASKTLGLAQEALSDIFTGIHKEVLARPHLYPKLVGILARGQAAVELDWLIDGYSKWSED